MLTQEGVDCEGVACKNMVTACKRFIGSGCDAVMFCESAAVSCLAEDDASHAQHPDPVSVCVQ